MEQLELKFYSEEHVRRGRKRIDGTFPIRKRLLCEDAEIVAFTTSCRQAGNLRSDRRGGFNDKYLTERSGAMEELKEGTVSICFFPASVDEIPETDALKTLLSAHMTIIEALRTGNLIDASSPAMLPGGNVFRKDGFERIGEQSTDHAYRQASGSLTTGKQMKSS
jgi:hypothetical protein